MSQDDLVWVKLNVENWAPPDRSLELPDRADYDAAEVQQLRPIDVPAATRETATCEACLQTRKGRRQTRPHSLVWGECLRAPRPLAVVHEEADDLQGQDGSFLLEPALESVDPENRDTVPRLWDIV